jgi:hypothetical protein
MQVREMDLKDYCCLNRPRLRIDPEYDASWFFGNKSVEGKLKTRILNDFNIRGVPKCGIVGRFGYGKTHSLYHIKHIFESNPDEFPAVPFILRVAPYDEGTPGLSGWEYIHGKMLNAMGESFFRDIVIELDKLPEARTKSLPDEMVKVFKFGDENLKKSLANILSGYFLRVGRPTLVAWKWLRGAKLGKGESFQDTGITKTLDTAEDMVDVLCNLGNLVRKVRNKGILFLIDEAQALDEINKRLVEIQNAFLRLVDDQNEDVGFIIAYFGTARAAAVPKVFQREDILSRLGVSTRNTEDAFIDLKRVINTENDIRNFILSILDGIIDEKKAQKLIADFALTDKVQLKKFPFTKESIELIVKVLYQQEPTRNARMIIETLARLTAEAYQQGKNTNKYILLDEEFVKPLIKNI